MFCVRLDVMGYCHKTYGDVDASLHLEQIFHSVHLIGSLSIFLLGSQGVPHLVISGC